MSDVVIRAEGLGKSYLVGHQTSERYTTVRDAIVRGLKGLGRSARDLSRGRQLVAGDEVEEFWALKDVSFEIKRGDVVGIIGRNGAGKSTLLKILSRITEPTKGRVEITGRVASLLEVGTGFHPELTGRENIFLNGAILGMSRVEIRRKMDEIIDFAGVEKFLDTPVKRYSSGMAVRLGFAVAAHLEPEILVVDEVLAVGDQEFQRKCLGKMQDVSGEGRTVLFVSHNMGLISRLCHRIFTLCHGSLVHVSQNVEAAISHYLSATSTSPSTWRGCSPSPAEIAQLYEISVSQPGLPDLLRPDRPIDILIHGNVIQYRQNLCIGAAIFNDDGTLILWTYATDTSLEQWPITKPGEFHITCSVEPHLLNAGTYHVEPMMSLHNQRWLLRPGDGQCRISFSIGLTHISTSPLWTEKRPGVIAPIIQWSCVPQNSTQHNQH